MKFKKKDKIFLQSLCGLTNHSLHKYLGEILPQYYERVVDTPDYIYAIGNTPICLVAHMDTVFPKPPTQFLYDPEVNLMWSPQGAGFDDRAGVFLILKIIQRGYRPHIIFTEEEENGGLGAQVLVAQHPKPFADIRYIIELDRAGEKDCVFYDCENSRFEKYISSFGFKTALGTFTDISFICPQWKIAGVNLSVGYDYEHTYFEILDINYLYQTLNKVINIIKDIHNVNEPFEYIPSKIDQLPFNDYPIGTELLKCSQCDNSIFDYEAFHVLGQDGKIKTYCPDCIVDKVEWCEECIRPFEIDPKNPNNRVCPKCLAKKYKQISIK